MNFEQNVRGDRSLSKAVLSGLAVKLLHKQLLVAGAPYLAIIIGVWLLHAQVVEPRLADRFQRETTRELNLHAGQIQLNVERAKAQLRLIAQFPAIRSGDASIVVEQLKLINPQTAGPFEEIAFCDSKSTVHVADGSTYSVVTQSFQEDFGAGKDVVTDVRFSHATKKPVILVFVPVIGEGGEKVGFVLGELAVTKLWEALQPSATKETTELALHVGPSQYLTRDNVATATQASEFVNSRFASIVKGFNFPQTRVNERDMIQIQAAVPSLPWQVMKLTRLREIVGPVRLMRNLILAMTALAMLCSLFLVWHRDGSLSKRLDALKESLQRFGAGNVAVRSQDQTNDEIGHLAEAFNCMADDVVHAQGKLRKELAEHEEIAKDRGDRAEELRVKADELERFASSVAHDLKAPLATMQGFVAGLEAAARADDWGRFRDDVARVQRTGDMLARMLESLLEYSRLGRATAAPETVSLYGAATAAVELLRGPIDRMHVDVVVSPLPIVKGDPIRWRQVFQNLIDNAVKACEGVAAPRIEIGCEERLLAASAEGGREAKAVCCFVRDNGAGLESGPLKKLFEPFAAGSGHPRSSGIGLALVKRVVALEGGKIWAESPGRGQGTTVFWSVVPVTDG